MMPPTSSDAAPTYAARGDVPSTAWKRGAPPYPSTNSSNTATPSTSTCTSVEDTRTWTPVNRALIRYTPASGATHRTIAYPPRLLASSASSPGRTAQLPVGSRTVRVVGFQATYG